ncbi:MAG: zinc protease [Chthoniobacter sp.]|jgi:zinc protease|nr:zinc protease [Chthoniobacter sp.]
MGGCGRGARQGVGIKPKAAGGKQKAPRAAHWRIRFPVANPARRDQRQRRLSLRRLVFLVVCACALPLGAAEAIPRLDFQQRTLPNGLQFIWLEDHAAPTVSIQVWYRVGSKDDPAGRSGFAHLFEHMMFKSTKRMPSEFLDRLTEDVGGENNAYTQDDVTVYHETVPSNHLERLLWAEAERLGSLNVDEANFHTEREVVKEEFRQRVLAEPYGEFGEFIIKQSFAEHPYKRPTIGNIEELDAASLEEVRAFHATFYRPDNAVLVVAGDFELKQLHAWVDRYFGSLVKPEAPIPRVTIKESPRTAGRTIRAFDAKVPLPALAVTYLGPAVTSEETPVLQVLARVLAGGESSRLNLSLVYEKELAQTAEFEADQRTDAGLLTFQLVLASGITVEKAGAALREEINSIAAKGLGEAELATAKNQVLAASLLERETCDGKAAALGYAATLLGDPARADTTLAEIQAVTAAQVQEAARKWFPETNRLTIEYLPERMNTKGRR